ncbi:uncharacterized protein PHALS_06613 [Plasmopara halstedii]|uniref:Uncharacterized protein n=1 Tax=Plasmopara halstedii TaxID=4781 RepID=A0A0P1B270_PLAHL|nr:uncharacterized protein PHALS_06613 [Plasmopara halstedii]CEG48813.1 hypothetical protein PHALS_06613 [Plasmopara halstedii]|eukprot:XP_024585182.1 hypothetical protein PHALS_06613 [Plasmopara halstedii]
MFLFPAALTLSKSVHLRIFDARKHSGKQQQLLLLESLFVQFLKKSSRAGAD